MTASLRAAVCRHDVLLTALQITNCVADAVSAAFPDITAEEIDILHVSNNGLSQSDGMRKVFENSNLETLDNAFETQVGADCSNTAATQSLSMFCLVDD